MSLISFFNLRLSFILCQQSNVKTGGGAVVLVGNWIKEHTGNLHSKSEHASLPIIILNRAAMWAPPTPAP